MSVWLDTEGNAVLSIAICDRCKMKRAYSDISQDRNLSGLRVCNQGCNDERDPYRLPARQPEKIAIRFPRPDEDIAVDNRTLTTDANVVTAASQTVTQTTAGEFGIATSGTPKPATDGNLNNLTP